MRITLSELNKHTPATILSVETPELQVALLNLGVIAGDTCELSDVAPLGDPIAIRINGTKISLRKRDAQKVWVSF